MLSIGDFKNAQELGEYLSHLEAPIFEFAHKISKQTFEGKNPVKAKGHGDDFWQYRNFENLEAANLIDWRISAKSDKLFVREFERQSPMQLSIWCDFSEQMFFCGKNRATKAKIGVIIALSLFFGFTSHRIIIKNENKIINKANDFAQNIVQIGKNFPHNFAALPYIIIFDGLIELNKLSDLIAKAKHNSASLFFIIINDKSEIEFDFTGDLEFQNYNDESKIHIQDCEIIREQYKIKMSQYFKSLEEIVSNAGFSYFNLKTDDDLSNLISNLWLKILNFLYAKNKINVFSND